MQITGAGPGLGQPTWARGEKHGSRLTALRARGRPSSATRVRDCYDALQRHMSKKDPRVDAYIAKSAEFARPILTHLRGVVHEACPDVDETIKWSVPAFDYKGPLCGMAAFKQHCSFGFWKGPLVVGKEGSDSPMSQFGRLTAVSDLPPKKTLADYIRKAMELNEQGIKGPGRLRTAKKAKPLAVPTDLRSALKKNRSAQTVFEAFSPSHRNEYVEWITEAKQDVTRKRRLDQAIEWMSKGKSRNWKYER
jgi:uncharacterized protein YdeI (YjbR/CyaY-like superfamily)